MRVRTMQEADIVQVAALEQEIFSKPWSARGFADSLKLSNTIFLVAEEEKKICGYLGMYVSIDEAEITNVAVSPMMRRRGIGQMLLEKAKKEAESHEVKKIVLEVRCSNDSAVRLYERSGFVTCGVRKGFYELPKEDALIMVCGQ